MANEKRLIDATEARKHSTHDFITHFLDRCPTVDAVEVVRCKDCVHRKERVCMMPYAGMWVGVKLKDDDFCSYGERKDNG